MKAIQILLDEDLLAQLDETAEVREKGRSAVLRELASDFLRKRREQEIDAQYERADQGVQDPLGKEFEGWEDEGVGPPSERSDPRKCQRSAGPCGSPPDAETEGREASRPTPRTLTPTFPMEDHLSMITTVTQKNMVTIPAEVGRKLGIKPGWKLDWQPVEGREEILVRVIPDRGELARRLLGSSRRFSPDRDAVSELVAERASEE